MHVISMEEQPARTVTSFGSDGFGVFPLAAEAHVVFATLAPGGIIGRHPAVVDQCLIVLSGEAEVSGEDGVVRVLGPGSAALWAEGESHETSSTPGLTAVIIEGTGVAAAFE